MKENGITKKQVQQYILENFDSFFVDALAKYVKEIICPEQDKDSMENYREEIKQLIFEGVSNGIKEYLYEYDGEAVKIIAREFLKEFSDRKISIHFDE